MRWMFEPVTTTRWILASAGVAVCAKATGEHHSVSATAITLCFITNWFVKMSVPVVFFVDSVALHERTVIYSRDGSRNEIFRFDRKVLTAVVRVGDTAGQKKPAQAPVRVRE